MAEKQCRAVKFVPKAQIEIFKDYTTIQIKMPKEKVEVLVEGGKATI